MIASHVYYRPGPDPERQGGDFFDVVERRDGSVRAVIGDVMGHGPDEAELGEQLRHHWRHLVLDDIADQDLLPALQTRYHAETVGRSGPHGAGAGFVTVCDVTLSRRGEAAGEYTATVRAAGHPAPLMIGAAATRCLDIATGRPLGLPEHDGEPGSCWADTQVTLPSAGTLMLYTDGLLDAYSGAESLGVEELVHAATRHAVGTADGWIATLLDSAPNSVSDDTAVVALTAT